LSKNAKFIRMRKILLSLYLLLSAVAVSAYEPLTIHYFDNEYRLNGSVSDAMERIAQSESSIKFEKVESGLSYTDGARFVIDVPEGLNEKTLAGGVVYDFTERLEVIQDGNSFIFPQDRVVRTFFPEGLETLAGILHAEIVPAEMYNGITDNGISFQSLYIPSRTENDFWEVSYKIQHTLTINGKESVFTTLTQPEGLQAPTEDTVEESSYKDSNLLLSVGAGGKMFSDEKTSDFAELYKYLNAAGTDAAALDCDDLYDIWNGITDGSVVLSTSGPKMIFTNADLSGTPAAGYINGYAVFTSAGRKTAFLSIAPQNELTDRKLRDTGIKLWDPKSGTKLQGIINDIISSEKADLVVLVSFFPPQDSGWINNISGVDIVIGQKRWSRAVNDNTTVSLSSWDSRHTAALTVNPDYTGAGKIIFTFRDKGPLDKIETLSGAGDDSPTFMPGTRSLMKKKVITNMIGSGDAVLPDPRSMKINGKNPSPYYSPTDFYQIVASLVRKYFKAEAAVLHINPDTKFVFGDMNSSLAKLWLGRDEKIKLYLVPGSFINSIKAKTPGQMTYQQYVSAVNNDGKDYYALSGLDQSGRMAGLSVSEDEYYLAALPESIAATSKDIRNYPSETIDLSDFVIKELKRIKKANPDRKDWEKAVQEAASGEPEKRALWRVSLSELTLYMNNFTVHSPSGYSDVGETTLDSEDQMKINGTAAIKSEYISGKFHFNSGLTASYGKIKYQSYTDENTDDILLSSEIRYSWKEFTSRLGSALAGPFLTLEYETEFTPAEGSDREKTLRGKAGMKIFEGTNLKELYVSLTTEQNYANSPYSLQYAGETGFSVSFPIPKSNFTLAANGSYKYYLPSGNDDVYDLSNRAELDAKLSTKLYRDLSLNIFSNYIYATGKKLPGHGQSTEYGCSLTYSVLFKIKR